MWIILENIYPSILELAVTWQPMDIKRMNLFIIISDYLPGIWVVKITVFLVIRICSTKRLQERDETC